MNVLINKEEPTKLSTKRISDLELRERVKERIPKSTADNTKWGFAAWEDWRKKGNLEPTNKEDVFVQVPEYMLTLTNQELYYWLAKFVLEVRRKDNSAPYHGSTLYQIMCGLQTVDKRK